MNLRRLLATDAPRATAAIPLGCVMAVAVMTTKVPMLRADGFSKAAHEGRTDFLMVAGLLFLFIRGAGAWSFDARLAGGGRRSR